MPSAVSEIASGVQFTRSAQEGIFADSQTRAFRIVLDEPGEYIDFQKECGVYIGDAHPSNQDIFCQSFEGRFDGESRMVVLATFNYATKASSGGGGGGGGGGSPDVRPANWTTSVATYESPVRTWRKVSGGDAAADADPAENPVGDMYDGVMRLEPIVTLSITQHEPIDPLVNLDAVGCINSEPITVGPRTFGKATVMLRSIQSQPVVEPYGNLIWRGWLSSYEFLYKRNPAHIFGPPGGAFGGPDSFAEVDIGWDVAVPQTGFNVKAFTPPGDAKQDPYGQPLKHGGDGDSATFRGRILEPLALPTGVAANSKVRGMIRVFSYENGGASQVPSAQPIALNDNGTPRIDTADPKVLIYRYRVYKEYDFNTLGLRLT